MVDIFDVDREGNALDGTPGSLSATVGGIGTIISVSDADTKNVITFSSITDATSYTLYWATHSNVTPTDNSITGVTSPYEHTGLSNGTTYYYRYIGIIAGEETGLSNELSGTPDAPPTGYPVLYASGSNDITTTAFGTWSGHSVGPQDVNFRAYITFDVSDIVAGASIDSIQLELTSYWAGSNESDAYYIGPYNGDGAGSPVSDGYATAYTRADCSSDYYLESDTTLRATGTHTFSLGAQAITDLLAIRAASGTTFTVVLRQLNETGTNHYATFEGWTAGNDAPKLRINNVTPTPNVFKVLYALRA